MVKIQVEKIIGRKKNKKEVTRFTEQQVLEMFQDELFDNIEELAKIFPNVLLYTAEYKYYNGLLFGVYYGTPLWYGKHKGPDSDSYNIAFQFYKPHIRVGHGVHSGGGRGVKKIPFSLDMSEVQLRLIFKQAIETLVSMAYNENDSFYKQDKKVSYIVIDGEKTKYKH